MLNDNIKALRKKKGYTQEQLARINEQLVIKNRRAHRIWKTIGTIFAVFMGLSILLMVLGTVLFSANLSSSGTMKMIVEEHVIEIEEYEEE